MPCTLSIAVSGEANFAMHHTGLTVGGFIQPSIARNLIEILSNVEKCLCQRFLWLVPQPTAVSFEKLQKVDQEFSTSIGTIICTCMKYVTYYSIQQDSLMHRHPSPVVQQFTNILTGLFSMGIYGFVVKMECKMYVPGQTITLIYNCLVI